MQDRSISVVVCTRDRAAQLKKFLAAFPVDELASLQGQLVLVDNGSQDKTESVLGRFARDCRCDLTIIRETTPGLSHARNAGLRYARRNVIVFTDDDCYLGDNYLTIASSAFDSNEFHFCGGRILLHNPLGHPFTRNDNRVRRLIRSQSAVDAGVFQGCNLIALREVIEAVGGFDTDFDEGGFRAEDIDFCAAALQAGFTGAHIPELVVFHDHGRSPGPALTRVKRANDIARGAFYTKWILRGHMGYATLWARHMLSLACIGRTTREVAGGFRYWRYLKHTQAARRAAA